MPFKLGRHGSDPLVGRLSRIDPSWVLSPHNDSKKRIDNQRGDINVLCWFHLDVICGDEAWAAILLGLEPVGIVRVQNLARKRLRNQPLDLA